MKAPDTLAASSAIRHDGYDRVQTIGIYLLFGSVFFNLDHEIRWDLVKLCQRPFACRARESKMLDCGCRSKWPQSNRCQVILIVELPVTIHVPMGIT